MFHVCIKIKTATSETLTIIISNKNLTNIIKFTQISNSFQTRLLYAYRNSRILKGDLKTEQVNLQKRSN